MRNLPFAAHEGTDSPRFTPVETRKFGSNGTREELGTKGNNTQQDCVSPGDAIIQEAQVRFKARKGEVLEKVSQPP